MCPLTNDPALQRRYKIDFHQMEGDRALLLLPGLSSICCVKDSSLFTHYPAILWVNKTDRNQGILITTRLKRPRLPTIHRMKNNPPPATCPAFFFSWKSDREKVFTHSVLFLL